MKKLHLKLTIREDTGKRRHFGIAKAIKSLTSFLLVVTLLFPSVIIHAPKAEASFNAAAVANNNLNTATLDIAATSTIDFIPSQLKPNEIASRQVVIGNSGDLPFQYQVSSQKISGNENACEFLNMEASLQDQPIFLGSLLAFNTLPIVFATSTAEWQFKIYYTPQAGQNFQNGAQCVFKINFHAWQTDQNDPAVGFNDRQELISTIDLISSPPPINVIYPNGGEHWYIVDDKCLNYEWCRAWCVAHEMNDQCQYPIRWNSADNDQSYNITIWYSNDSGQTWLPPLAQNIANSGIYLWKVPVQLEYASDKARIKIMSARNNNGQISNTDISDADFCPPILTLEDLFNRAQPPQTDPALQPAPASLAPMTIEQINADLMQIQNSTTTEFIAAPAANAAAEISAPPLTPTPAPGSETLEIPTLTTPAALPEPTPTP